MIQKSILFLMSQAPYVNQRVFEAFDALLVAAAFEQKVSLLFRGNGITQLLADQAPSGQRSLSKMVLSLSAYEVEHVYADAEAFARAGLSANDCAIAPTLLARGEIIELINAKT